MLELNDFLDANIERANLFFEEFVSVPENATLQPVSSIEEVRAEGIRELFKFCQDHIEKIARFIHKNGETELALEVVRVIAELDASYEFERENPSLTIHYETYMKQQSSIESQEPLLTIQQEEGEPVPLRKPRNQRRSLSVSSSDLLSSSPVEPGPSFRSATISSSRTEGRWATVKPTSSRTRPPSPTAIPVPIYSRQTTNFGKPSPAGASSHRKNVPQTEHHPDLKGFFLFKSHTTN